MRRTPLKRRAPIRRVSRKRARQNRERSAMARRLYPDRPPCAVPWCPRWADDLHEPRFRSRLGSITDPANAVPVCRQHHAWIHTHPAEAGRMGFAIHSWEAA